MPAVFLHDPASLGGIWPRRIPDGDAEVCMFQKLSEKSCGDELVMRDILLGKLAWVALRAWEL